MRDHPVFQIPCDAFSGNVFLMPYPTSSATVDALQKDHEIETLLCLLPTDEQLKLGIADEEVWCRNAKINFLHFPIDDYDVPKSIVDTKAIAAVLLDELRNDSNVAIHCRAGIGRSSLICTVLLLLTGMSLQESLNVISKARGVSIPETKSQKKWLEKV